MRWAIKRSKLLLALIPIISIAFYIFTADHSLYADQSFVTFDIYQHTSDTAYPQEGKETPDYYTAAENFAIAAQVFLDTDNIQCSTLGKVTAMGFYKQTVINYRAIRGDELFSESISLSAVASVAEQRYFRDGAILYRKGFTKGGKVTGFSEDIVELNPTVYRQRYGVVPREITKYCVSKASIKSGAFVSHNEDGTYTYELTLIPEEAHKYARYEMMTYAGVTTFPEFYTCRIEFTIDENWVIRNMVSYDTYKIALMGGTRCESRLEETYTYDDIPMPERSQIFRDYKIKGETGSIGASKGAAEYLGEAFGDYISGAKQNLGITANLDLMGTETTLTGIIDIIDDDYRFALGDDIFAAYDGNRIYLKLKDGKYRIGLEDMMNFISSLTPDTAASPSPAALFDATEESDEEETDEETEDGGILSILFADCEIVNEGSYVHILMPFKLYGLRFRVDIGLKITRDGTYTADTVKARITTKTGGVIVVDAQITDTATVPSYNPKEYVSLQPMLDAIRNTVDMPSYRLYGKVTVAVGEKTVPADYDVTLLKTEDGIQAQGTFGAMGTEISVWYKDGTVYLGAGGFSVKATTADLSELMKQIGGIIPDSSVSLIGNADILGKLLSSVLPENSLVGALDLLKTLSYDDGTLSLGATAVNGNEWSLTVTHDDILRALNLRGIEFDGYGAEITVNLDRTGISEIAVDEDAFIDVNDLAEYAPVIRKFKDAKAYAAHIDTTVTIDGKEVSVSGNIAFDRASLAVRAILNVGGEDVELIYREGTVYIYAGNLAAKLDGSKLSEILGEFGVTLPSGGDMSALISSLMPENGAQSITEILNKIVLTYDDGLNIAVRISGDGYVSIRLNADGDTLTALVTDCYTSYNASILTEITALNEPAEITPADREYIDVYEFKPFIKPVKNTSSEKVVGMTVFGTVSATDKKGVRYEEEFTADATVSFENGVSVTASITVSDLTVGVAYDGKNVYIDLHDVVSLKVAIADLPKFAEQAKPLLGENNGVAVASILSEILPELSFGGITEAISRLKTENGNIVLTVVPENGNEYTLTVTANEDYITGANISGFTLKGCELNAELTLSYGGTVDLPDPENYTDAADFLPLISAVGELINAKACTARIDTAVVIKERKVSVSGDVYFDRDSLAAQAVLSVGGEDVELIYIEGTVYIRTGNFAAKLACDDLKDILKDFDVTLPSGGDIGALISSLMPEDGTQSISAILDKITLSYDDGLNIAVRISDDASVNILLSAENGSLTALVNGAYSEYEATVFTEITALDKNVIILPPEDLDYIDLSEFKSFIRPVLNTVREKTMGVKVTGTVATTDEEGVRYEEEFTVNAAVSLGKSIAVIASVNVSELTIDLAYDGKTVYIDLSDKASLKVAASDFPKFMEEIKPLLGDNGMSDMTAVLSEILPKLSFGGITEALTRLKAEDGNIVLPVVPENGKEYTVTLTADENHITGANISGLTLKGYELDAGLVLTYDASFEMPDPEYYTDAANFLPLLTLAADLINAEAYEITVRGGYLGTSILSGDITDGSIIVNRKPMEVSANLTVRGHDVSLSYVGGTVYVRINNIRLSFKPEDIDSVKEEINDYLIKPYESEANVADENVNDEIGEIIGDVADAANETVKAITLIEKLLGGKNLGEIADCITALGSKGSGNVTLGVRIKDLSASVDIDAEDGSLSVSASDVNYGANVYNTKISLSVKATSVSEITVTDESTYVKLKDLQSYIKPTMQSITNECCKITFNNSTVYDRNGVLTTINGELKVDRSDRLKIYANVILSGNKTGAQNVKLYLVNVGESGSKIKPEDFEAYFDVNGFTAMIDYTAAIKILGELSEMLSLDIPAINELTAGVYTPTGTKVFETMAGLSGIRKTISSMFATAEDVSDTASGSSVLGLSGLISDDMMDKALVGLTLSIDSEGFLAFTIDNAIFGKENEGLKPAVIKLKHNGEYLEKIDMANIVANGDTVNFKADIAVSHEFTGKEVITAPASVKCDLRGVEDFLYTILKTADIREFEIKGNFKLGINVVLASANLPIEITARIKILDDGTTVMAFSLDIPRSTTKILGIPSELTPKSLSNIYFANGMIYFIVDEYKTEGVFTKKDVFNRTNYVSCTPQQFAADPYYYIFDVVLRLNSTVKTEILKLIEKSSMTISLKDTVTNINSIVKTCAVDDSGKFTLVADLGKLTGNSSFSDVTISIATKDNYVTGFDLSTKIASVVNISISNTSLTNLRTENGKVVGGNTISSVVFGSDKKGKTPSAKIDDLEDDLALFFPVEGATTFAKKANDKAALAKETADYLKKADAEVTKCEKALTKARAEYKDAKDALNGTEEGSWGYQRKATAFKVAKIALARAESNLKQAKRERINAATDALEAAKSAKIYSDKAAKAAAALGSENADLKAEAQAASENALKEAENAVAVAEAAIAKALASAEADVLAYGKALTEAQNALEAARKALDETDEADEEALEEAQKAADEAEADFTKAEADLKFAESVLKRANEAKELLSSVKEKVNG